MKIAGTGLTPKASAFFAPVTPKRLSAAASQINSSTASRESRRARSATRIAEIRAAMMNQGFDIEVEQDVAKNPAANSSQDAEGKNAGRVELGPHSDQRAEEGVGRYRQEV